MLGYRNTFIFVYFETQLFYVAKSSLKLVILLYLPPPC